MNIKTTSLALAAATALVSAVSAADLTNEEFNERHSGVAVSGLNAKLELGYAYFDFGGEDNFFGPNTPDTWDSGSAFVAEGAVSFPISNNFGMQIDAGYLGSNLDYTSAVPAGAPDDLRGKGIGAHLFWRDSTVGLLGVYAHYTDYDYDIGVGAFDFSNTRVVAEAEYYLDQLTLKATAGIDKLDIDGFDNETYFSGSGSINYYFNDNFLVNAGVRHSFEETSGFIGGEYLFTDGATSFSTFAEAQFGDDNTSVNIGLRAYFGQDAKSLKLRHREDDPDTGLFDNVGQIGKCLGNITRPPVQQNRVQRRAIAEVETIVPRLDGCSIDFNDGIIIIDDDNSSYTQL